MNADLARVLVDEVTERIELPIVEQLESVRELLGEPGGRVKPADLNKARTALESAIAELYGLTIDIEHEVWRAQTIVDLTTGVAA